MKHCATLVSNDDCFFKEQSLLIFDRASKDEGNKAGYPSPTIVKSLLIMERTETSWQIYVGYHFRSQDHMAIPTVLLPSIIRAIRMATPALQTPCAFLFIHNRVETFKSTELGFYYAKLEQDDISDNLRHYALEFTRLLAKKDGPAEMGGSRSKRGTSVTLNNGLQTQNSHRQYLARYCQLSHAKPIPSLRKVKKSLSSDKKTIMIYHILVLRECELKLGLKPFELDKNLPKEYREERWKCRQTLIDDWDPAGTVKDKFMHSPENFAEANTGKGNDSLGKHSDDENCPVFDVTVSCTAIFTVDEVVTTAITRPDVAKRFNIDRSDHIASNSLYYTRKTVHNHASKMSKIRIGLANPSVPVLTKFCLRMLQLIKVPVDYQGYLWEHEMSFHDRAMQLSNNGSVLKLCGAFEKMGYLSIFAHVFFSLYCHGFLVDEDDVLGFDMYFGFVQNGTTIMVSVWQYLLANKTSLLSIIEENKLRTPFILFDLCVSRERKMRTSAATEGLRDKGLPLPDSSDLANDIRNKMGSNPSFRYQHDSKGNILIRENRRQIFETLKEILSNPKQCSTRRSFLDNVMQRIDGVGHMRANQFLQACCISGIVPLAWMKGIEIGRNTGPAKLIELFGHKGEGIQKEFVRVAKELRTDFGLQKLTDQFLDNMFCESKRIASHNSMSGWTEKYWNVDYLMSEKFRERVESIQITKNPDIYFLDDHTKRYQHLFRVIDNKLFIRDSSEKNDSFHSPFSAVTISYNTTRNLQVSLCGKSISDLFCKN